MGFLVHGSAPTSGKQFFEFLRSDGMLDSLLKKLLWFFFFFCFLNPGEKRFAG